LLEDRRRRLWVGTVRGGLHLLVDDGPEPRFRRFPTGDSGLTNSSVFSLFEDRSGTLWVGTYLGLFSGASDVAATSGAPAPVFRRLEPAAGALTSELIYWVEEDPQGRLWIGTAAGLDRLSADRTVVESNLLKPGMVPLQMVSGPDGKLWMATGTDGLISVDPMSEKWRRWAPDLGMGVGAMGTSFDALGRLWVTGKRHLRRLDLDTGEVRVFDDGDGLRVLPFQQQAFHRGPSGRFFVGGTNGLAVFYPEELSHPPLLAPVVLRGLSIANEAVAVDPEGPLVRSIETLDVLTLPPDVPTFSIEFAALTYHRQETVRYAHRLRGYSDAWIESGPDRRRATFTNLSPGEYTFEVKARGDVGPWAPETASLRVRILPEWHEVFWVRGLALLLAVGLPLVWLGHRYRRVEKHRRELQALVDRWQMERRQRRRWQHLSVDAAQLAQQIRGPLEQILHRARAVSTGEVEAESGRTLADQLLDPAQEATTKLEALVSFVVESPSDIHPVDLGELLDAALLAAADEMQAAGLIVRHRLRGTRVHADRDVLETLLREVLRLAVEGAGPGDALLFAFDREGAFGRLKIEGLIGPGAPARGRDPGPRAALEAVEELAARLEWTLDVETAGDESTRVDLSGLRPVS
ncbi:MAG: two-component regulator propeller domain-containing protein, partial [Acidobacteriota bacterium]